MVSVRPKESNIFLKRFGKMDDYTQPTIWVSFEGISFIKSIFNRGFEIIFFNFSENWTGFNG